MVDWMFFLIHPLIDAIIVREGNPEPKSPIVRFGSLGSFLVVAMRNTDFLARTFEA